MYSKIKLYKKNVFRCSNTVVVLLLIMLLSVITVSAEIQSSDGMVTQDFSGYQSVDQVLASELWDSYTSKPRLSQSGSTTSIVLDPVSNKKNTLLMSATSEGSLSVDAVIASNSAPKVNWGYAPQILIRYIDKNGVEQEESLIEFAYSLIRVRVNNVEKKISDFQSGKRYNVHIGITRKYTDGKNLLNVSYGVNGIFYDAQYNVCEASNVRVGFSSGTTESLYIDSVSRIESNNVSRTHALNFNDYQSIEECYPASYLVSHTNVTPTLTTISGVKYFTVPSKSESDNILLMRQENFKYGSLKATLHIYADHANNDWNKASKVILRYINQDGKFVNDGLVGFANNSVIVNTDAGMITTDSFRKSTYQVSIIAQKRYSGSDCELVVDYNVGGKSYTKTYKTKAGGTAGIALHSIYGNSLYIKTLQYAESCPYRQPGQAEIKQAFNISCDSEEHPRVMMNQERLAEIKTLVQNDENVMQWYETIKKKADNALLAPVSVYELRDGQRLLYVSRDVYANTVYPALVYLIEGDERYLNRIWEELNAVSQFDDWHPTHFLDTAEMTYAFAICYDWLYSSWTDEQRSIIKNAIKTLGLDAALEAYNGTAQYDSSVSGAYHNRIGWKDDASNWGLVCNSAIAVGAMAIIDSSNTDYCAKIISEAIRGIESPVECYSDDGSWSEGLSYWHYATMYFSYMMSTMQNVLGDTYGYLDLTGVMATVDYFLAHSGAMGVFNYGDCSEVSVSAPELFYFGNVMERPEISHARLDQMKKFSLLGSIDDIVYYKPSNSSAYKISRNNKFNSIQVVTSVNSDVGKLANYFAIKGGKTGITHGDLDIGTFVLDSIGERWVSDLGADSYLLDGYFFWDTRYKYYRKKAEGHSTLVINPDDGPDQKLNTAAVVESFTPGEHGMCAVLDMSNVYSDDASSVKRAVAVTEDYSKFIVHDSVKNKQASDVYWFMQTTKDVVVADDGKSATLSSGKKHMKLILQSDCASAKFEVTAAAPLPVSPNPVGQNANEGYYRIAVKSANVTSLNMRVIMIPYIGSECPSFTDTLTSFDTAVQSYEQAADNAQLATLDAMNINGRPFEEFESQQYVYQIANEKNSMARIECISSKYDVTVTYGALTEIIVSDPEGKVKDAKYYIQFENTPVDTNVKLISKRDKGTATERLSIKVNYGSDVYIAHYDNTGRMISAVKKNQADIEMNSEDKVKLFVWKKNSMQPLKNSILYSKEGIK